MNERPIIVLEGIDGSGKSTQGHRLAQNLAGRGWTVAQPTRDRTSRLRRFHKSLIKDPEVFLGPLPSVFLGLGDYADILEQPTNGPADWHLFDRYCYSTITDGIALGLDPESIVPLLGLFPTPKLCLYIDLPPQVALRRKGKCSLAEAGGPVFSAAYSSLEESFVAYQQRLADAYRLMIDRGTMTPCVTIDGTLGLDEVETAITDAVQERLLATTQHDGAPHGHRHQLNQFTGKVPT